MIKKLSSFTTKTNQVITSLDARQLLGTELLDSIALSNIQFDNVTIENLSLENNNEITSISFLGSEGLIIPSYVTNITVNTKLPIPKKWAGLSKLTIINFQSCGFNQTQVNDIVKSMADRVQEGLGSAIATGKQLILNGQNAPLLVSNAEVLTAKNYLISKGWTILHI